MTATTGLSAGPARPPWFRRRPRLTLLVAGILFLAVLVVRLFTGDPVDAYSMLYALPIALLATAFGLRAGLAGAALAVVFVIVWAVVKDVELSPVAWASRVVPILLLGVLLGEATERNRRAERARRELQAAALLHREAIEINDSLVQGMAAVKWSLEAGNVDASLRLLEETIARAQELVSGLIRQAEMGQRTEQLHERT